ncbi:hypothetical protein GGS20DRAFT_226083 [Poronia punctata]|nr:hypothetical protein GGS20DRAFT_226083 [Poronia punctata]
MTSNRNLGFDVNAPGTALFIIQMVFLALAWVTSLSRSFVKLVLLRKTSIDDYLMLTALLGYTVTGYFVFSAIVDGGLGTSIASPESAEIVRRNWYGNMVVSGPVSGLVRVSIALFLLRLSARRWQKILLHIIIGTTTATTVVYSFIALFQCSPPSYYWKSAREGSSGSCRHTDTVRIATLIWGSLAAAMDWVLGILPIIILWHVRINRPSKVGIAGLLSFGIIAGITLVVRLVYIGNANRMPTVAICGTIELALGIIAGCTATLPPLFKRMGLHLASTKRRDLGSAADTLPWQKSFVAPEPQQETEDIVMVAHRQLTGAQEYHAYHGQGRGQQPRTHHRLMPMPNRSPSSSIWGISTPAEGGKLEMPPSGRERQVPMLIRGMLQPSREIKPSSTPDYFAHKPLPLLPLPSRAKPRDRPVAELRPLSPTFFF